MPTPTPTPLTLALTTIFGLMASPATANMCYSGSGNGGSGSTVVNLIGHNGNNNTCPADINARSATSASAQGTGMVANSLVANPIEAMAGNKFEQSDDWLVEGDDIYVLHFSRFYNSQSKQAHPLGYGVRTTFDAELQDGIDHITVMTADGSRFVYRVADVSVGDGLKQQRFIHSDPSMGYLIRTNHTADSPNFAKDGRWQWHLPDGRYFAFTPHRRATDLNPKGHPRYGQLSYVSAHKDKPTLGYWQLHYDTQGRLAQVDNHLSERISFSYTTTKHHLPHIQMTTPVGVYHYYLDKHGNLTQVVNPNGERTGYGYTDKHDKHNLTARYRYDNQGKAILMQSWHYDSHDRAIQSVDPHHTDSINIRYDDKLNDAKALSNPNTIYTNTLTNTDGQTTTYRYQIIHGTPRLLSVTGAGCTTCQANNQSYTYDDKGRIIHIHHTDTDTHEYIDYDSQGNIERIRHSDGATTDERSFGYTDDRHPTKPTQITMPSIKADKHSTITLSYDEMGNITETTHTGYAPDGDALISKRRRYSYTTIKGQHKLHQIIQDGSNDPAQANQATTITLDYDDTGRHITAVHYGSGNHDSSSNKNHNKTTAHSEYYTYKATPYGSQLIRHTDISGQTTHYHYNPQGLISKISSDDQSAPQHIHIGYDDHLRPTHYANHLGQSLEVDYHALTLKVNGTEIISLGGDEQDGDTYQKAITTTTDKATDKTTISPSNNLLTATPAMQVWTDKDGAHTTVYLDDFGRVVQEISPTTGQTHYTWDDYDRLIAHRNDNGQVIRFSYDVLSRLSSLSSADNHTSITYSADNSTQHIRQDGIAQDIHYDSAGNITAKTWHIDEHSYTISYDYNAKGQLQYITYPSGLKLEHHYNQAGQLDKITQNTWWRQSPLVSNLAPTHSTKQHYTFNFANGISQHRVYRDDGVIDWAGTRQVAYSHSTPYQDGYVISYEHVADGDMVQTGDESVTASNAHTSALADVVDNKQEPNELAQHPTDKDIYNNLGQLTHDDRYHYHYDDMGRLVRVTDTDNNPIANYAYLHTGERYKKTLWTDGTPTVYHYLYDDGVLMAEIKQSDKDTDNTKPTITEYLHHHLLPIVQFTDGKPHYLTTDHRGAVIAATDHQAKVVWRADLSDNGYATPIQQDITINLRGSNQYHDTETNLHYNTHRYFDPQRNQYITPDPLGLTVGDDLYAFANNRPHEYVDLWGLEVEVYEWRGEHEKVPNPKGFGTYVHGYFGAIVKSKGLGWGANGARKIDGVYNGEATWPTGGKGTMLIDAWHVSSAELTKERFKKSFSGSIWELKPATYKTGSNYQKAITQINGYLGGAKRGKWQAGGCYSLRIPDVILPWQNEDYFIHFENDVLSKKQTGLIFYSAKKVKKQDKKDSKAEEKAAETLENDGTIKRAKENIDKLKKKAKDAGWTPEKIVGTILVLVLILVLIVVAIEYALIAAAIAGFLFALNFIVSQVSLGLTSLSTALSNTFGKSTMEKADKLREKRARGTLEKWYDKFNSWFK